MAKHIGIVACSAEGAALCYRTICAEAPRIMGEHMHPEVSMHTFPLGQYMVGLDDGDWTATRELMITSAKKLASIGADFLICPDNTVHEVFADVEAQSEIPWLHIAIGVGDEARRQGYNTLAVLGTKYLMTGSVYSRALERMRIGHEIPGEEDRERVNTIIFKELVNGVFTEESRLYFNDIMQQMKDRGCDAAVLGCTEIPLIVNPDDCPLPTLDSTRLLARAALEHAL